MPDFISYDSAIAIATEFAKETTRHFPGKIEAVFVIGSLGSDYYRPGQSDIDTALITLFSRQEISDAVDQIEEIAEDYHKRYHVPKGFGAIVFAKEQLYPPYIKEVELVQEILRLKSQGKLIYGDFHAESIPMPDKQAIKNDIIAFQEWCDAQPPFQHSKGTFVDSTLIALKRYLLLKYDIVEFNKFKVIDLYLKHEPPLVHPEIFQFITKSLHGESCEWNETVCQSYTKWHDELYRVINAQVL